MTFKKIASQNQLQIKGCASFCFCYYDIIFEELSKLGQTSCVIPYYIEIKDTLQLGKFFVALLENWYKMKKTID